jgi:hypothetical protein
MRCLFVVDEVAGFRDVAVVLDSRDIAMTMVKESALASRLAELGRFDMVIVGTNSFASESMRFLQRRRAWRCAVVAVTCQPDLQRTLVDAGADRVVLLPDGCGALGAAFDLCGRIQPSGPAQGIGRGRLWQRFGLW